MDIAIALFELIVLIFSAVLHEVAHGYEAERLGDDTARRAGRLTLNPIVHLDLFGSILMPVLLYIASGGSFFFAAAKPVPYNPNNLKNPRFGGARIALAGPITNFLLAIVFGLLVRLATIVPFQVPGILAAFFALVCLVNLVLGLFNLIPIPPLDGSRVLFAILPQTPGVLRTAYFLERWGFFVVIIFALFGFQYVIPLVQFLFTLLTGQTI